MDHTNIALELHAKSFGTGRPILIFHGFLGMGDNWKTIGKKIANQGYEVHLLDLRNHGRSPHSDDFNYELLALDILKYIECHRLQSAVLIGHSMGGKAAMWFATTYPGRLSKLIVIDIAPKYYAPHHAEILSGLQALDFTILQTRKAVDETLKPFVPQESVREFLKKNIYWKSKGQLGLRLYLHGLLRNVSEIGKALPTSAKFDGNALFVRGEKSNYIAEEDMPLIQKHFDKASIVVIPNAGHWVHYHNPTKFLEAVLDFI